MEESNLRNLINYVKEYKKRSKYFDLEDYTDYLNQEFFFKENKSLKEEALKPLMENLYKLQGSLFKKITKEKNKAYEFQARLCDLIFKTCDTFAFSNKEKTRWLEEGIKNYKFIFENSKEENSEAAMYSSKKIANKKYILYKDKSKSDKSRVKLSKENYSYRSESQFYAKKYLDSLENILYYKNQNKRNNEDIISKIKKVKSEINDSEIISINSLFLTYKLISKNKKPLVSQLDLLNLAEERILDASRNLNNRSQECQIDSLKGDIFLAKSKTLRKLHEEKDIIEYAKKSAYHYGVSIKNNIFDMQNKTENISRLGNTFAYLARLTNDENYAKKSIKHYNDCLKMCLDDKSVKFGKTTILYVKEFYSKGKSISYDSDVA